MATKRAQKEIERQEAVTRLRKILKPGMTVYTVCKSRSGSGMYRHITVIVATKKRHEYDEAVSDISGDVSTVLDWRWHDDGSVGVSGCGMDMGFHLVYTLSRCLFPDGFKLTKGQYGRNGDKSGFDADGGYALRHKWL